MFRRTLGALRDRLEATAAGLAAQSSFVARLYYALASPRFAREQLAVLLGRRRFGSGARVITDPLLRRNIHRLEKGLLMRPRAPRFAEDYIQETVDAFARASLMTTMDEIEVAWAGDVLSEYFSVVGPSPVIDRAKAQFTQIGAVPREEPRRVPRPRKMGVTSGVAYDAFLALCQQRRSVRWFQDKPVPRELITQALAAAAQAPSACNRQPFCFRLLDDAHDTERVARISMGTTGYAQQIPSLIVVLGDFSSFAHERDRHLPYIDGALAAMQFMLALETLGLASCPINWPDVEELERRMDRALELPVHIRPIMLIAVGFADPDGGVAHSAKRPVSQLLRTTNEYEF